MSQSHRLLQGQGNDHGHNARRGSTDNGSGPLFHGVRYGHGHSPVLEGAGGIGSFKLQEGPAAEFLAQPPAGNQGRIPLHQGNGSHILSHREKSAVSLYQPPRAHRTRMVVRGLRQQESCPTSSIAAKKSRSIVG